MSKKRRYGRRNSIFDTASRHFQVVSIAGNPLATTSKHSQSSLNTDQKPKKKNRKLTKAKRRQNRGR